MIRLLLWIGIVRRRDNGTIRWPVYVAPWWIWKVQARNPFDRQIGGWFGLFRNLPGLIKWEKGRLLPRRWGFRVLGLEIGDRG